jgi:hypothetical protein
MMAPNRPPEEAAPAPEVLGRAPEDLVKPFVRWLAFDTLMPEQPDLDGRRGVRQIVSRDDMGFLERSRQWTRDDGCKFRIDK